MSDGETKNPLEMSDEEFLNSSPPPVDESEPAAVEAEGGEGTSPNGEEEPAKIPEGADPESGNAGAEGDSENQDGGAAAEGESNDDGAKAPEGDKPAKEAEAPVKKDEPKAEEAPATFAIPTTFKANGKDIQLRSEEEAVKLMQMGANYTREMQKLAPQRKLLMMLQTNGLDENKLNFLIDLDKKNPEAIKKLIQDAGIDPMDIDPSSGNDYLPNDHSVSDKEAVFRSTLESLATEETGKVTIHTINTTWDETSKKAVWENPEILTIMHEQRATGVYDFISKEVERRITLGQIKADTPFLEAYRIVGDELSKEALASGSEGDNGAKNGQDGQGSGQTPTNTAPVPVATRPAAPKANVSNDERAKAASTTKTSPTPAKQAINFLSMPDEEFMKQMDGRL